jgi:hypothetical protein
MVYEVHLMLFYQLNGAYAEWKGEQVNGIRHPANVASLWTEQALNAVGLFNAVEPEVPDGKVVTGRTAELVNGVLTVVYQLTDAPLEPVDTRLPPLDAWKFWAVVEIAGLTSALNAAIDAIPDATVKAVAKAKLERTPKYFRSDALFSNSFLLSQLGMTSTQIDALWTQAHQLS